MPRNDHEPVPPIAGVEYRGSILGGRGRLTRPDADGQPVGDPVHFHDGEAALVRAPIRVQAEVGEAL